MSKLDTAAKATKLVQNYIKPKLQSGETVSTLTKQVKDIFGTMFSGVRTAFGDSFVGSAKTILEAGPKTKTGKAWTAVLAGGLINGGLITYNSVNAMEDSRRLTNMSANLSDFHTPYSDATNVLKMSGGAAALGLIPAATGLAELAGSGLENVSKGTGVSGFIGRNLNRVGSAANKAISMPFKFLGKITGSKVLGKHYWAIAALTLGRAAYKTLKIDMIKNPNGGLSSLNIGGKSLFIDNDPSSPTYRQSIFLKDAIAKREKENQERSIFTEAAEHITKGAKATYNFIG